MPLVVFPALVLKSYETGNTSEVLHVLSAEYGRLSVFARGLRGPKSRFGAVLQPLSVVELSVSMQEHGETANLRDAALLSDHAALVGDLERFSLALLLAEAASVSCHASQPAPEIFAALLQGLSELDPVSPHSAPLAATRGMAHLLDAAGYQPQIDPDLLRPWVGRKPNLFWLDVTTGLIHGEGSQPINPPGWPMRIPNDARHFPIPPAGVRFLYELERGGEAPLPEPQALQLLEGLVRLCEYSHDTQLRAAAFWREISGQ